jgi:hypothetical protein
MVCSHPELDFPYWASIKPVLEEGLLVPFYIKGEAVGTIRVVAHDTSRRFDAEDLRVLTSLAAFAEAAYQRIGMAASLTPTVARVAGGGLVAGPCRPDRPTRSRLPSCKSFVFCAKMRETFLLGKAAGEWLPLAL